ncbi:recombinase family protein [Nocardia brasiliensis]|uniref:recombinase family protein n=1 Tax=Nocardia brasiliensis TaxID=37326 RepID=UPI0036708817
MIVAAQTEELDNPDVKLTAKERRALVERLRKAVVRLDRLASTGLRIGIYARISRDRKGFARGVERQIEDDVILAHATGGTVVAIYVDNDMSAYSGKPRPDYERMLMDIEAGLIDAVIAWHPDRLHRSPAELERFIEIVERWRVEVRTVKAGHWDLTTPSGRMVARQLGAVARYESEHKSDRATRERQQRADIGQWAGGPRPYGYEPDGVTLRPSEQQVIEGVIRSLSAGISLRAIVTDLNARGVPTPRSAKRWTSSVLRNLLLKPRIAGLSSYRGVIVGKGAWPALVSEDQWRAVQAMLMNPERRTNAKGAAVRWLGSGIFNCGGCNEYALSVSAIHGRRKVYRCNSVRERRMPGEIHVARDMLRLDEYVEFTVVERLSRGDLVELFMPKSSAVDVNGLRLELAGAKARLDDLSSLFADDRISAAQLATGSEKLRVRVDELERDLADIAQVGPLAEFATVADVERHWFGTQPNRSDGLSLMKRRAIIDELVTVTILPGRCGSTFDPSLVDLSWKIAA